MSNGEYSPKPRPLADAIKESVGVNKATRVLDGADAIPPTYVVERMAAKYGLTPDQANAVGIVAVGILDRTESDGLGVDYYDTIA